MAIDKKLQIFDDEGNPVDYDILANDVKFLPDGKDLPTKLAEMEEEIGEGGYTPPQGGIPKTDLAPSVQQTLDDVANKVDKETGKGLSTNDYTTEDKTKLAGLPTNPVQSISVNGTAQSKDTNGNVNIEVQGGGLTKEDISVETQGDGTVDINVGEDTYTINLNHTHENMAKLVITDEEPSDPARDTIYALVDDATTPTAIQSLWIAGLEFVGGGAAPGEPAISLPRGSAITLDTADGQGGATGLVTIKAKNITAPLTVSVGSGFSLSYGQQSGSSISIPVADAIIGADVTVAAADMASVGTLLIQSQTDNLNKSYDIRNVIESLAAVKFTGAQWLQTDYYPNENTQIELSCKFEQNLSSSNAAVFLYCKTDNGKFYRVYNESSGNKIFHVAQTAVTSMDAVVRGKGNSLLIIDNVAGIMSWTPNGESATTVNINTKRTVTSPYPMEICRGTWDSSVIPADTIYQVNKLTVYSLVIKENGTVVRNYQPQSRNGIPGLYDTVNNNFISSETSDELVAIQNS